MSGSKMDIVSRHDFSTIRYQLEFQLCLKVKRRDMISYQFDIAPILVDILKELATITVKIGLGIHSAWNFTDHGMM